LSWLAGRALETVHRRFSLSFTRTTLR